MKKILEAFRFRDLETFCNIISKIKEHKKSPRDVIKYVKEKRKLPTMIPLGNKCPECRHFIGVFPVNTTRRNQVGEGFNSQWWCPNCGYERYSKLTVKEEVEKLRGR